MSHKTYEEGQWQAFDKVLHLLNTFDDQYMNKALLYSLIFQFRPKGLSMKRLQLTDEEVRIIENFRHTTAVIRAYNEGLLAASAIVTDASFDASTEVQLSLSQVQERIKKLEKGYK